MTTRRTFMKKSALALAGSSLLSNSLFSAKKGKEKMGIQLYSIREDMKKDPLGSLTKLAEFGYKYVEHANYIDRKFYGYTVKEFKKILQDLGMEMPSGHTVMRDNHWDKVKKDFTDEWKYTIEDAAEIGQEVVISPSMGKNVRTNYDELLHFLDGFNTCGELCQKSGMRFGYHNHDFEFSEKLNGKTLYDIIMENTDPKLVIQQLDIGNMYNGGAKAEDIMNKYPGRFYSMHVKDEIKSQGGGNHEWESAVLGVGIINVKEMIDLGRSKGGTKHFIVEQEAYQGKEPIACMKENYDIMKKWGY